MHPRHIRIEDYTYELPDEKIARHPAEIRDTARLLIYQNDEISEDIYRNISSHIPAGSLMVFNRTRVVHARLLFRKPTGGLIEIFCLEPDERYPDIQAALAMHGAVTWNCLVGGAAKWKKDIVLTLPCPEMGFTLSAQYLEHKGDHISIGLSWDNEQLSFSEILEHCGKVPLPPYLGRASQPEDSERYQTVFAADAGSVAAPTAGLHFTPEVLHSLEQQQVQTEFITLHVGAGTFRPVKSERMEEHTMHAEWIKITDRQITTVINHLDKNIVATGTTTLRTLESLYWIGNRLMNGQEPDVHGIAVSQWEPYGQSVQHSTAASLQCLQTWVREKHNGRLMTRTQLLIAPGYAFRVVTGLVTNFHQPRSTLLLLVAAFAGPGWRKMYDYALTHPFRFLSYGDGCLIWRNQ